jgi:hypothetical protein
MSLTLPPTLSKRVVLTSTLEHRNRISVKAKSNPESKTEGKIKAWIHVLRMLLMGFGKSWIHEARFGSTRCASVGIAIGKVGSNRE